MKGNGARKHKKAAKERAVINRTYSALGPLLLLTVLGIAAYWNALNVPLVFDDLVTIQKNAGVQFGDSLFPTLFGTRPLLYITFTLNYMWHGEQVFGYHVVNIALHILTAFLVFFIAHHVFSKVLPDSTRTSLYAFLAAALFLLHPVQTESVTYIANRSEGLSTLLYAAAFLLFIKRDPSRIGFVWSLVVAVPFALGLLSKETVISLPAAMLVYDYLFFAKTDVRSLLSRWPFYATFIVGGAAAAYALVNYVLGGSIGANLEGHLSSWHYLLTQSRVIVKYIQILFFPVGLNLDYDFRASTSLLEPAVLASLAVIASLLVAAWYLRRRNPVVSFSILFFFLALAPTSSFVPILDVIFEHRLYLPLLGVCLSFPVLIDFALKRVQTNSWLQLRNVGLAILAVLLVSTVSRNHVWGDDVRLWNDVIEKSPEKARGYSSLAMSYFKRADYPKALEAIRAGLQKISDPLEKRSFAETMGNLYLKTGQYDSAIQAFRETTETDDELLASVAYNNIGVTYLYKVKQLESMQNQLPSSQYAEQRSQLLEEAEEAFLTALGRDQSILWSFDSYINVAYERGRRAELEAEYQAILRTKEDYKSYYALGKLAFNAAVANPSREREEFQLAVDYFAKAKKINATHKIMFFNNGYALDRLGRTDEAIESYLQAIRIEPLFGEAHHNVALLYMKKSEFDRALKHLQDSLRLDPKNASSHANMAAIYVRQNKTALACQHLTEALSSSPSHAQATAIWNQAGCGNRPPGTIDLSRRNER